MAITIRNKQVEALIRGIGRETGEGPSALIARPAQEEAARRASAQRSEAEERYARLKAFLAATPPVSEEDRRAVWQDLEDMYDEDGLPR